MDTELKKLLDLYDYDLSEDLIAQEPASPRDAAKLLAYSKKENNISYNTFKNLAKYLPEKAVLVFNETKVLPARLILQKETGGRVKILYISKEGTSLRVMADRKLTLDAQLQLTPKIYFTVCGKDDKYYLLKPSFDISKIFDILEKYGKIPIPPYIKHSPLSEKDLKKKYQTVFARSKGSVAAPTAALHFTDRLITRIKRSGCEVKFVTLHVNLGTFAPLTKEHVRSMRLHEEYYEIDKKTAEFLNKARRAGRPIIAVGTTVVRTLESASIRKSGLKKLSGTTDLFIREGYEFKFVDGIITNFHVPRSSLLMLVAAFVGREKLFELYQKAIDKKFKFFSFGDGMIIY